MRPLASILRASFGAAILAGSGLVESSTPKSLGASELIEKADLHLGHEVVVEIVEPLDGPATPEQLAGVEYGQVRVDLPDAAGGELCLVPSEFRLGDPRRYLHHFDRVLASPVRVRGELLEDRELSRPSRRALVLRVASIEPLPPPVPIHVASAAELLADPRRFDRATIEVEGNYESRFEVSAFEGEIWLTTARDARVLGNRAQGFGHRRVRVVGTVFAKPGARYGHLGGYSMLLVAREIEYR